MQPLSIFPQMKNKGIQNQLSNPCLILDFLAHLPALPHLPELLGLSHLALLLPH
jgi:hypothetical protein